jgi:hypothetical protein
MQYDENAEKYGYEGEMTPIECDELKAYKGDVTIPVYGTIADAEVYLKKDVDAAIAELKAENEQLKKETEFMHSNCKWDAGDGCARLLGEKLAIIDENEKLKQKLESVQASAYADSVDAGMRERRLKSALWLARANHADTMQKYNIECKCDGWVHRVNKWVDVERKCRTMAEKFK